VNLPGLMIGAGNTGSYLNSYDTANMYISKDGGWTWESFLFSPHACAIGRGGSLIVCFNSIEAVNYLYYSTSGGYNSKGKVEFQKHVFDVNEKSNVKIRVITAAFDDTGEGNTLLITGLKRKDGDLIGIVTIGMEFSDKAVTCEEEDFTQFTPPESCILGQTVICFPPCKIQIYVNILFSSNIHIKISMNCLLLFSCHTLN